jgi:hypothetical protein
MDFRNPDFGLRSPFSGALVLAFVLIAALCVGIGCLIAGLS